MQKIFEILAEPKKLEDMDLSPDFMESLILKIINTYGIIRVQQIHEITGIHVDILEACLRKMEKQGLCAPTGGGILFNSVEFTIKEIGHQKALKIMKENPYQGMAPVPYQEYYQLMEAQLKGRYPLVIPEEVIENAFKDVVGMKRPKKIITESAIGGTGFFIYGPPGTGKTFLTSKMSEILPPLVVPKFVEFSGNVIQLYDPDFHRPMEHQPGDPRWVKIYAPFVFTGSELSTEKLETVFNPQKGVFETSPLIKANGGVLLIDDLGRQQDDHNAILNRLIVPLENKKDVIYVNGVPVILHTYFIPAFSTNLEITIVDEAHLRRAPQHIPLEPPSTDEILEVFERNLDALGETYDDEVLESFRKLYLPLSEGGESLKPTFAHARDVARMAQAIRIRLKKDRIDVDILQEALEQHILVYMQRRYSTDFFDRITKKSVR